MGSHALSATPTDFLVKRSPTFHQDALASIELGEVEYAALPGIRYGYIPLDEDQAFLTVIPTEPSTPWTKDTFVPLLEAIRHEDDVSEPEFQAALLFCGTSEGSIELPQNLTQHLSYLGLRFHVVEVDTQGRPPQGLKGWSNVPIPGGPYLCSNDGLRPLYRLHEDKQSCLMHYVLPSSGQRKYTQLRIAGRGIQSFDVAVPSRIPHLAKLNPLGKPFAGKRVLIKDVFDLRGICMTLCDRSYHDISSPAQQTAPAIQSLIERGASVVGTTKLSSMISWEEPSECMDFPAPFNPRGDGYQSPAGSSSGSAAAIASYKWLDYAIGTDSTGSCRRPAMVNGCFAIRISTGALPSEGMAPCFPLFDAPAVFARDVSDLAYFLEHWDLQEVNDRTKTQQSNSVILPLEYFDAICDPQQRSILDSFIEDVRCCFSTKIRGVSLQALWDTDPPIEAEGQTMHAFLQDVGPRAFFFDYYHSTDQFRENYWLKHHTLPPVNKMTAFRWKIGSRVTEQQRLDAGRRLEVYKSWLLSRVLCGDNPIVILPIMNAEPKYRDDQSCGYPTVQEAWNQLWLSPVLGSPEVTVPIGQIPYISRKTGVEEMLPVAVSILGLPGTDLALIQSVESILRKSQRPLRVATGKHMFVEDWEMV